MSGRASSTFTDVELEFMQLFWEYEQLTPEQVQRHLASSGRDLADGSVRKVLTILLKKGHLTREKQGRTHVYRPSVVPEQAHSNLLQDMLQRVFSGSPSDLVATLLSSEKVSRQDLGEIRDLLDRYEREKGEGGRP